MLILIKRVFAFIIDWNITLIPVLIITTLSVPPAIHYKSFTQLILFVDLLLIILAFAAFIMRDVIFKGRSPGKRIFGLYILDKASLQSPTAKQLILRNAFFFLTAIDIILLFLLSCTIGDQITNTVILSKNSSKNHTDEQIFTPIPNYTHKQIYKRLIILAVTAVALTVLMISSIHLSLSEKKDTEEYKCAYSYFVESDTFNKLNVEESEIIHNKYSLKTVSHIGSDTATETATIGFIAAGKAFEVTCHKENGVWQICSECTPFR